MRWNRPRRRRCGRTWRAGARAVRRTWRRRMRRWRIFRSRWSRLRLRHRRGSDWWRGWASMQRLRRCRRRRGGGVRLPVWVRKALPAAVAACVTFIVTAKYMLSVQHTHDDLLQKQLVKVQEQASSREQRNRELVTQTELLQSPALRLIRM